MMESLLQPESRDAVRRRAARLEPTTPARWGRFTAPRMLGHVIQSLRMMTGELAVPVAPVPWVVRRTPVRQLLIYVLPLPRGLPTSPELLTRPATEPAAHTSATWAAERAELERTLDMIGARSADARWPIHPAFGPLTGRAWGVQQYRHLDHHFRQFGV